MTLSNRTEVGKNTERTRTAMTLLDETYTVRDGLMRIRSKYATDFDGAWNNK